MKLSVQYAGLTDPGRVRQSNEDNWTAIPEQGLFIVADGMGGQFAGALASKAVVETLPGLIKQHFEKMDNLPKGRAKRWMAKAIAKLSSQIRYQTQNEPGLEGMGSTVVCALVRGDQVLIAHMGDSRAYRLRAGRLKQLTKDHSLVELLISSGDIKPEQAATHPARNRLTRNVGMDGEPLPQTRLLKLKFRDVLLLCTDGLTGMLTDQQIQSILNKSAPLESICQQLVDAANQAGGTDNVTALLLSVGGGEKKPDSMTRHAEIREKRVSNQVTTK
jgi:PPM family protein phosphatase